MQDVFNNVVEFVNNQPLLKSLVVSIVSKNILEKFNSIKASFSSPKNIENDSILNAIDKTCRYAIDQYRVTIKRDDFFNLFQDADFCQIINNYSDGHEAIDLNSVSSIFVKYIESEYLNKEEIYDIIEYNYNNIINNFLENKVEACRLIYTEIKILQSESKCQNEEQLKLLNDLVQSITLQTSLTSDIYNKVAKIEQALPQFSRNLDISDSLELSMANDLARNGCLLEARKSYKKLLEKCDTNDAEVCWKLNRNLGLTYIGTANETESIKYFKIAYNVYENTLKGQLCKLRYLTLENIEESINYGEFLIETNPSNIELINQLAYLYLKVNRIDDCKKIFSSEILDDSDTWYYYSVLCLNLKDYEKCEFYLNKLLSKERNAVYLISLCDCIVASLELNTYKPILLDNHNAIEVRLKLALNIIEEALSIIKIKDSEKIFALASFHYGIVKLLLGKPQEAIIQFNEAEKKTTDNLDSINFNRGLAYAEINDYEAAICSLKKAYDINNSYYQTLAILYYENSEISEAEAILLKHLNFPKVQPTDENCQYYIILADIYNRKMEKDKYDSIIFAIEKTLPHHFRFKLFQVLNLWNNNQHQQAINDMLQIYELFPEYATQVGNYLADFYYSQHDYFNAYQYYYKLLSRQYLVKSSNIDKLIFRCSVCLLEQKKYQEFFILSTDYFPINREMANRIKIMKADVYFIFNNYQDARKIYSEIAPIEKHNSVYVNWALAEYKLANYQLAESILDKYCDIDSSDTKILIQIAKVYADISKPLKGVMILWTLYSKRPNDVEILQNYFYLVLLLSQRNEEVKSLSKEQIELFQKIPNILDDNSFIQPIICDEEFSQLKQIAIEHQVANKNLIKTLQTKLLSITLVAKTTKDNVYNTWLKCIGNKDIHIESNYLRQEPLPVGFMLLSQVNILSIDSSAFYLLNKLDLITIIDKFYKIIVPQNLLDEINEKINQTRNLYLNQNQNLQYLTADAEGILIYETQVADLKADHQAFIEMQSFAKDRSVGQDILGVNYEGEIEKMSHRSILQSFLNMYREQSLTVSDEKFYRNYFKQKYNINSISTYVLIHYLFRTGKISKQKYISSIYHLLIFGYVVIPFSSDVLIYGLEVNNYDFDNQNFQILIETVMNDSTTKLNKKNIMYDLFVRIDYQNIDANSKKELKIRIKDLLLRKI